MEIVTVKGADESLIKSTAPTDVMIVKSHIKLTCSEMWEFADMIHDMKQRGVVVLPKDCDLIAVYNRENVGFELETEDED